MEKKYNLDTIGISIVETGIGYQYYFNIEDPDTREKIRVFSFYPTMTKVIIIDGEKYLDQKYYTLKSEYDNCIELPKELLCTLYFLACNYLLGRGKSIEILPYDKILNEIAYASEDKDSLADILPNTYDGELDITSAGIQLYIDKPVRKPCLKLTDNGIKTLMSSANKDNIYNPLLVESDEDIFIGKYDDDREPWIIGNGFAWILLDWDDLNDTNKAYLLGLHDGIVDSNLNIKEKDLLEKIAGNDKQTHLVKFYEFISSPTEDYLRGYVNGSFLRKDNEYDKRSNIMYGDNSLCNHSSNFRTVVLRYPVDATTKVEDVERYFDGIVNVLVRNQPKKVENHKQKILD